jgi:PEP-CTERM motif-containing protein
MGMHKEKIWSMLACAALLFLAPAPAAASPILDVSVTSLASGLYEYHYQLTNAADEIDNIYDFGLFFTGDVENVQSPEGWSFIAGLGFIDWFSSFDPSTDPPSPYDIRPGATLLGFSFVSTLAPGAASFLNYFADDAGIPTGHMFEGTTTGPSLDGPTPVPEPATMWLFATGAAAAWRARRMRRA